MISLYFLDVARLSEDSFEEKKSGLSEYRRKRIEAVKAPKAKILSLGAGLVTDYGLRKYGLKESQMIYSFGSNNKPYFENYPDIFFNISHSGDYCMAAFSDGEIGCDIEQLKDARIKIAPRFFTEEENEALEKCESKIEQDNLFYKIWTLKESFVKLSGKGLAEDFRGFNVLSKDFAGGNVIVYEHNDLTGYCAACCGKRVSGNNEITYENIII